MEFSSESIMHLLKGSSLCQKISCIMNKCNWGGSTNLEEAFNNILRVAVRHSIPQEEMPKALIVISDMEIDQCTESGWNFYEGCCKSYQRHGYEIPNVIFWNVDSRHDTFLADANRKGVLLVSGSSASTFRLVLDSLNLTAYQLMEKVVNSERYAPVTVYPERKSQ